MARPHCITICLAFGFLGALSQAQSLPAIHILFTELNQPKTTDRAAQQILQIATKDSAAREYVTQRLPGMIDRPNTNKVWLNAVRLAGQLRASEAIPSLQRALARGPVGGLMAYSMTREIQLDDDLVAKALSEIGEAAIPTVSTLLRSEDRKARRRAVLILRNMDTPAARRVLQDRLSDETDTRIKELIETCLRS